MEYKAGKRKTKEADMVQLAAQALCLEEMFDRPVAKGALYYYQSRRRLEVDVTKPLRRLVEETIQNVREMLGKDRLPPPVNDARCRDCSLQDVCMPQVPANVAAWISEENDHD
ncbi:CRISPR-associated RecB family exonuclease Cas4b [Geobacillus stearothermophilus]|uniref:CRISPR-associated exonuclease Cas4 n=1 Tax=Geobacillus stearothermophilus TaxID=1422 RepID=A0ABQ7HD25_GEOSE|nr:CRISPR-associated RecB family exonuclease Cas4b [Geobacillus stearothermophilus]